VLVPTELRDGGGCPLPERLPQVSGRTGIDVSPLDVADEDAMRWVAALIWADQPHRHERFWAAVRIAREAPAPCIAGNGVDVVTQVVAGMHAARLPCIFHSHTLYQMHADSRRRFGDMVSSLGRERDLAYVSLEWLDDQPRPQLHATFYLSGTAEHVHLADCHTHGAWMRWVAT
jgi:hypothetical protein